MADISREFKTHLPEEILQLLREIGEAAKLRGERAFLVGGVVRDLLLGYPSLDLDLVIEGKAIPLAHQLAKTKGWEIKTYPRFGTATLYRENFRLDLATARSESYPHPGALPVVQPGTIAEDLFRRDFTINAIAVQLSPDSFGEFLDPYEGRKDLAKGLIRILHENSFKDDPTRILRGIRYEQRFDFHLEGRTKELLRRDLAIMDLVTGERLWHELELMLKEDFPEKGLRRADELGVLQKFHPSLHGDTWLAEKFAQVRKSEDFPKIGLYLGLLVYRLNEEESEGLIRRLKMPGWASRLIRDILQIKHSFSSLTAPTLKPSEIYYILARRLPEAIKVVALASDSPLVQERLELYLHNLRFIKPSLDGLELQKMGVKPGKEMGRILRALYEARLNQEVRNRGEEEELVRRLLTKT